jgi:zinc transport system substrate-binding protein
MKIIIAITLMLSSIIFGCKKETTNNPNGELMIVASFYPVYIIAKNIADGADGVKVINMTPPITGCLHDYSITTEDMKNLEKADIFLINGAGMESFSDKIAKNFSGLRIIELSRGIPLIKNNEGENPHVWVSISNIIIMVKNCAKALSEYNPVNTTKYRENANRYIEKLTALNDRMHHKLAKYRGKKIITFHEAFPYFAKEFGFEIAAVIEREPGSEPSVKELADTINIVRKAKIRALFAEPQYPSSSAKIIAKETGAQLYILDPAVTGDDDKDAYINIMEKNLSILEKAMHD